MNEKQKIKTTIGGQALIEGLMMRGPEKCAIVVRKQNGEFAVEEHESNLSKRPAVFKLPVLRGMYNLADSFKEGIKALNFSASFFEEEDETEKTAFEKRLEKRFGAEKMEKFLMSFATALGVLFPIALFILLPTLLAGFFDKLIGAGVVRNLAEGLIRIVIFLSFIILISRMKDIKRTFSYHGAEHKTIFCYEEGAELTVENVSRQSRLHPRCGTSFLFVVMIISILVFSLFSWSNPFLRVALRLMLLPLVVGISYEINRYAGRHDNRFTRFLRAPGLWLQRFTTFEPDDSMMETAIEALKRVIPEKEGADRW